MESFYKPPQGSVYIYTGSSTATIYQKRSDGTVNTGWFNTNGNATTTIKGLVNQSAASADTASAPSATYDQSEVQAILTELRDLKAKMRTAGLLAT